MGSNRIMMSLRAALLGCSLTATTAAAQTSPSVNVFFGFEFLLQPLAVKWACGGASDQDLAQIDLLVSAFPEASKPADLGTIVDAFLEVSRKETGLADVLGAELTNQRADRLCAVALPLNIDWVTPDALRNGDDSAAPQDQVDAWKAFWNVVEKMG